MTNGMLCLSASALKPSAICWVVEPLSPCFANTFSAAAKISHRIRATASIHGVDLVTDSVKSPHLLSHKIKGEIEKEERKKLIEEAVIDSWKYDHLEEDDKKKQTDREILCDLWQIYISNDGSMEVDGETISFVNWSGKSKLDMDEKDLDAHWDLIWQWNQDDQYYGSDELKDWIWNEQYFGLKLPSKKQIAYLTRFIFYSFLKLDIYHDYQEKHNVYDIIDRGF